VSGGVLHARWLGRVEYEEALDLQHSLFASSDAYLLLLEHPHVYTLGVRTDPTHLLVDPARVGARALWTDRGGDITYHGPGQLVGYPIIDVPVAPDATPRYVHTLEAVIVEVLASFGIEGFALEGFPGVWVDRDDPRKIAAIGVKLTRGRSMHGFALNVSTDLGMFGHIVPCGIADKGVTSLAAEGVEVSVQEVARRVVEAFARRFEFPAVAAQGLEAQRVVVKIGDGRAMERRLARAGFDFGTAVPFTSRKPAWIRPKVRIGDDYRSLEHLVRGLGLVTVCEEAGCPNIYECWADGTATFMINGATCTRACSFCLVDTGRPHALDPEEPRRVAEAVAALGLSFAVVTAVARDDLPDGGARAFAETIEEIRRRNPGCSVEVLIPDFKGDPKALAMVLEARPDVLK
jgi:lipoic acid synthetase